MAWIEYHEGLREHWKVQRLADALGCEYLYALGAISCLWLWCIQYAQNGDLTKFTDAEIRIAARTKSEKFSKKTLIACELLNSQEQINDWKKHGLKLLVSTRKRMKKYRERLRNANVTVTPTVPNRTVPNRTVPLNTKEMCVAKFPTLLQVKEYFTQICHPEMADSFFDHYDANGWKVGNLADVNSWTALARKWVRRSEEKSGKTSTQKFQEGINRDLKDLNEWEEMKNGKTDIGTCNKLSSAGVPKIGV